MGRNPQKIDAMIEVFAGTFDTQPLVYAHLHDAVPDLDLGEVEVICRVPPQRRLEHYFDAATVQSIIDLAGLRTSLVLVLPGAMNGPMPETGFLSRLGQWRGSILRG